MSQDLHYKQSPHVFVYSLCGEIARAIQKVIPAGFRAKLTVNLDGSTLEAHNISVEFRPPQPKAGQKF